MSRTKTSLLVVAGVTLLLAGAVVFWPSGEVRAAGDPCPSGRIRCVDDLLADMTARFDDLAERCDHDAVFALLYLRTTEAIRAAIVGGRFDDPGYLIDEDIAFAQLYFDAYDPWHAGDEDVVPGAWQVALDGADDKEVSGAGNLTLGVNAHITRDLPFVLAQLGLTAPDGSSRKPDHDRVNEVLRQVSGPALDEVARRFDPSVKALAPAPGTTLDTDVFVTMIASLREDAWHNAERLVAAETDEERQQVADDIERQARRQAMAERAAYAYPPAANRAVRDNWCAEHGDEG